MSINYEGYYLDLSLMERINVKSNMRKLGIMDYNIMNIVINNTISWNIVFANIY